MMVNSATSAAVPASSVARIPLVIGVTGHRDLRPEDTEPLEQGVRAFFSGLQARYPHTPLVLLSSLAEGADRLAARVALRSGVGVIVPLPMPQSLYEQDFQPPTALPRPSHLPASLDEFHDLLGQAQDVFALPILRGSTADEVAEKGGARDRQYEQAGAFMTLHSQILLALWDGESPLKVGGTTQVVRFQLEGVPARFAPHRTALDHLDNGPVHHFETPRLANPTPKAAVPYTVLERFPRDRAHTDRPAQETYHGPFKRIEAFNRDIAERNDRLPAGIARSKSRLFPDGEELRLPHSLKALLERYAVADALALHFQRKTYQRLMLLFLVTFFAALFLGSYADLRLEPWISEHDPRFLVLYLAAVIAGLTLVVGARRGDFQNKFQDYRALAEGLRVQLFWRLAGLPHSVADRYLLRQRGELDWIRQALRVWALQTGIRGEAFASANGPPSRDDLALVLRHWIRDQSGYYGRVGGRDQRQLAARLRFGKAVFYGSLIVAGAVLLSGRTSELLILAMTLLPVGAALLHGHAHVKGLSEHAKQFSRMRLVFARAEERLSGLPNPPNAGDVQGVIQTLGDEALAENGDWLLLHRERPLDFPQSGG